MATAELKSARALPNPPHTLSEAAQKKWHEMMPQLALCRPDYTQFELDLLADYCRAYSLKEMANLELSNLGTLSYTARGVEIERPQLKTMREAEKVMDRVYRRLGLQKKAEATGDDDSLDLDED